MLSLVDYAHHKNMAKRKEKAEKITLVCYNDNVNTEYKLAAFLPLLFVGGCYRKLLGFLYSQQSPTKSGGLL
jgi:hypothetical protein